MRGRSAAWLHAGGLRPTRQRLALAELLVGDGRDRHVTAESLHEAALNTGASVSLATVYNTLRAFCDAGLLTEVTVDGTRSYFDTRVDDHPHYYWEEEGRLSDAPNRRGAARRRAGRAGRRRGGARRRRHPPPPPPRRLIPGDPRPDVWLAGAGALRRTRSVTVRDAAPRDERPPLLFCLTERVSRALLGSRGKRG
jgi:Fur family transcriptional regulator, iron response regulator